MNRVTFSWIAWMLLSYVLLGSTIASGDDINHDWLYEASLSAEFTFPQPDQRVISKGAGLVFFDNNEYPRGFIRPDSFTWDEPNAPYTIGIAFDTHNPPPTDTEVTETEDGKPKYPMGWFDEAGNWYDRPQREISIHVDGVEIHNMLSPVEYRTGKPITVEASIRFVTGAALLDLNVAGESVLDDFVLLGIKPFRAGWQSMPADEAVQLNTMEFASKGTYPSVPLPRPVRVNVFDSYFVHSGDRTPKTEADFSDIPDSVARVVATLTLAEPEVGYDHWDKKGVFYIWDKNPDGTDGTRFELLRYITPFRKGWTWKADVTHLLQIGRAHV